MNNQCIDQTLKIIANFKLIAGKSVLKPNNFYAQIYLINEFVDNLFRLLSYFQDYSSEEKFSRKINKELQ